jgi:predicted Zn-dependent peptidase
MKRRLSFLLTCILGGQLLLAGEVPLKSHPDQLEFPDLQFEPPEADSFRVTLDNGIPVYIAEDRMFPLVNVRLYFRGGSYLLPDGKEGLAGMTGEVWRTGGAGDLDARALDEELDFLAARLSTGIGELTGSVTLNLLSKDLDRGLEIMMDVLLKPRFQEDRLEKAREDLLAGMRRRNDRAGQIESREWSRLIYGEDFWANRLPTEASVAGIERQNLIDFHRSLLNPANMILVAAGDFDREEMLARLNATFGKLTGDQPALPPIPQPTRKPEPGVYLVNKPDVNQGRVSIGHLGVKLPMDNEFGLRVGNDILGGGGFTSWLMTSVRSDEGLAYSAGSSAGIGRAYPGVFRASFQSKSSTCSKAAQLTVELINKLILEGVAEDELSTSKNSFIQTFPNWFQSAIQTVSLYAQDELIGRPHEYWKTYRQNVSEVTTDAVKAAAREHIHPDNLVVLVVGNIDEILKGHPDHPEASFEQFGKLVRLPLRDPMTLEPLAGD